METSTDSNLEMTTGNVEPHSAAFFYVVYDSCVTNNVPSADMAFIEQRNNTIGDQERIGFDEVSFNSLREAKWYVKNQFRSGAEYFSLKQSNNPDNFFYLLIDKISYLLA